jgi:uncharacterized protein (DUF3820 family)
MGKYKGKPVHEIEESYATWAVRTIRPQTSIVGLSLGYLKVKFAL